MEELVFSEVNDVDDVEDDQYCEKCKRCFWRECVSPKSTPRLPFDMCMAACGKDCKVEMSFVTCGGYKEPLAKAKVRSSGQG